MFEKGLMFFRRKQKNRKKRDAFSTHEEEKVAEQVTDALTSADLSLLGNNTAYALDQAFMAHSQAHGTLFANMVSEQQKQVTAGQAAALKSAATLFGLEPDNI